MFTIHIFVKNDSILLFFPCEAGDIEENVAGMEQGISYDLLGNNLEGKLVVNFVI